MKTLIHRSPYADSEYELAFTLGKYSSSGNLYVEAYNRSEFGGWEPYADITVNLGPALDNGYGYLDMNNLGNSIKDELLKAGIIEETDEFAFSGFCCYPLVHFNMDVLKKYSVK